AVLHFTIGPDMLGSARSVVIMSTYTVLFVLLVGGIIYATRFYRDSIERARSDQELLLARRIQRSFLLSQFPSLPRLEVHAVNVSSKQVSGDFYDVVVSGDGSYLLEIVANINRLVYRSTAVEQFATLFLARIDERTLRLSYSNAGHNFPVVFHHGGGRETLERGGTVVGILESARFEEAMLELLPGDR